MTVLAYGEPPTEETFTNLKSQYDCEIKYGPY